MVPAVGRIGMPAVQAAETAALTATPALSVLREWYCRFRERLDFNRVKYYSVKITEVAADISTSPQAAGTAGRKGKAAEGMRRFLFPLCLGRRRRSAGLSLLQAECCRGMLYLYGVMTACHGSFLRLRAVFVQRAGNDRSPGMRKRKHPQSADTERKGLKWQRNWFSRARQQH